MATYAELMAGAPEEAPSAPPPVTLGGDYGASLNQAGLGLRGGAYRLGGTAANAAGFNNVGAALNQSADEDAAEAAKPSNQPSIRSIDDVHSLDDAAHFAASLAGGITPILAGGVVGRFLGGAAGAYAGTAGAIFPGEAGSAIDRAKANPNNAGKSDADILAGTLPSAVGATALQTIAPGGAVAGTGERAAGGLLKNIAVKGAEDAGINAATSGAAEAARQQGDNQLDPTKGYDTGAMLQQAKEGAAAGAAFGAVHAIGHKVAGTAAEAAGKGSQSLADYLDSRKVPTAFDALAGGTPEAPQGAPDPSAAQRVGALIDGLHDKLSSLMPKPAEADPGAPKQSADYSGATDKIVQAVAPLLPPDVTSNPAQLTKLGDVLRMTVTRMSQGLRPDSDSIVKLMDITGDQTVPILEAVQQAIDSGNKKDTEAFYQQLNAVHEVQEGRRSVTDLMAQSLKPELQDTTTTHDLQRWATELDDWASRTASDTAGQSEEMKFRDSQLRADMVDRFGPKADAIFDAIDKTRKDEESLLAQHQEAREGAFDETKEGGAPLREGDVANVKTRTDYYSDKGELYDKSAPGKGEHPPAYESAMARARKENPDAHVRFATAEELGNDHPLVKTTRTMLEKRAVADGLPIHEAKARAVDELKTHGVVTAESTKQETEIGKSELHKVLLDTHKYGDSPSRIDTLGKGAKGNVAIDATRLIDLMHNKLGSADDFTSADNKNALARKARMFMEGIAAVQQRLGVKFDVPDSTVLTRGKDGITWGEVKAKMKSGELRFANHSGLTGSETYPKTLKWLEGMLSKTRQEYKQAVRDGMSDEHLDKIKERGDAIKQRIQDLHDQQLAAPWQDEAGEANKEEEARAAEGRRQTDAKRDQIHKLGDKAQPIRTDESGLPRGEGGKGLSEPAKPDERANAGQIPRDVRKAQAEFLGKLKEADPAALERVAKTENPRSLQRAVDQLILQRNKPTPELQKAFDALNKRLGELMKARPDEAYAMSTKRYSLESDMLHANSGKPGFGATHDSPHKFDGNFDWRKNAFKGEGAMVYGAGTYLSTGDGVHKYYKKKMTGVVKEQRAQDIDLDKVGIVKRFNEAGFNKHATQSIRDNLKYYAEQETPPETVRKHMLSDLKGMLAYISQVDPTKQAEAREIMHALGLNLDHVLEASKDFKRMMEVIKKAPDSDFEFGLDDRPSPTYHVSVDIKPSEMLNWDKKLSEQDPAVRAKLEAVMKEHGVKDGGADGEYIYRELSNKLGSDAKASDALQAAGILGHEYAAANGKDSKAPNYVIYDDSKISNNFVHFDKTETPGSGSSSAADRQAAVDEIKKTLGPSINTEWAKLLHAGEFERKANAKGSPFPFEDTIRLSIHALDPRSVAYHESLHGLFAKLGDSGQHDAQRVLEKFGQSAPVLNQLRELLKNHPEALKQLSDPEERAAYAYQFYRNGKLNVGPETRSLFDRVTTFIKNVLGIWSNDQRALHIMDYFAKGDFAKDSHDMNAVHEAMMESGKNKAVNYLKNVTEPFRQMGEQLAVAGGARLRDSGIQALRDIADFAKRGVNSEGADAGFLPAARAERSRWMNMLGHELKPFSEAHLKEAFDALKNGTKPQSPEARQARSIVRAHLDMAYQYMQDAGVKVNDLGVGKSYFPRAWDAGIISSKQKEFTAMIQKYIDAGKFKGTAKDLIRKLTVTDGNEFGVETDKPGMQFLKPRELAFIDPKDAAPFVKDNLYETMNSYMTQATRRAEWARRVGDDSAGLQRMYERAKQQGATDEQIGEAKKFIRAVDGTLGDTINPTARRLMGNMIVYQNIRLLPLGIFSSVVDPLGIVVRGGSVKIAAKTFLRGIKEIKNNFSRDPNSDDATRMAELIGTIDNAMLVHTLGASYSQGMVGNKARHINDMFFRLNFMEQFNSSMRVGATEAAMDFIQRHAAGENQHSARYMNELGLSKSDVKNNPDGSLNVDSPQIKMAINRWVDGAVLRPDAVDKPLWMSDPRFALIAHLKQFVYAFHETILKRVAHEAQNGNYSPAMALASYVPTMIAADMAKALIQGGGGMPASKQDWGPEDWAWDGVQRGGLLGSGQFAADALGDINRGGSGFGALTGPTVEQFTDGIRTLDGNEAFKTMAINAMPANQLFKSAANVGGGASHGDDHGGSRDPTDQMFAD